VSFDLPALIAETILSVTPLARAKHLDLLLEALEAADFDLVILDNQMPVMSGAEAAEWIRGRGDWKMRIPIIALTADAMGETEQAYREVGVSAFIAKPLDVAHVMDTVKRLGEIGRQFRKQAGTMEPDLKAS
jgi:CheY-like chemotaxis protein